MGGRLTRKAYEELIAGDIEWLMRQPATLERSHIVLVLSWSADREYGEADESEAPFESLLQPPPDPPTSPGAR